MALYKVSLYHEEHGWLQSMYAHAPNANGLADDAGCVPRGSVRITDGLTPKLGRVEVCLSSGTWSRIDARSFDNATAKVVCSQVGHAKYGLLLASEINRHMCCYTKRTFAGAIPFDTTFFRPSRTPTIIKSIRCLGTESSIAQCSQEYYSEAQNVSDAGIYCPCKSYMLVRMLMCFIA